jgi:hypothetical protein
MDEYFGTTTRHWLRRAGLILVVLAAVGSYAPALHAYFVQDDFLLLAEARLIDRPLLPFIHDHFPGSLFFRPLGLFVWWLATAVFDNSPRAHYAVNLALHLGCTFALFGLLQRLRRDAPMNLLWTLAFAVHPVAIGTALWLSDRFDLLASLFLLLAIGKAIDYAQRPRAGAAIGLLACVLLSFMGKEIAIVGALAACALIGLPNRAWPLTWKQRWPPVASILLLTAGWLFYRAALMTNPQNSLLRLDTLITTFASGIAVWLRVGIDYFIRDPRQAAALTALQTLGALVVLVAVVLAARARRLEPAARNYGLAAALAILILLPAPTQAPVISIFVRAIGADRGWFNMAIESRLYHITLAAVIVLLMLLTTRRASPQAAGDRRPVERLVAAGIVLSVAAWIPTSHGIAHDYASHSREQIALVESAQAAIARLSLPRHRCQIYLLGLAPPPDFGGSGDAIIKATAPDLARLDHCLILTERTPWANFVRTGGVEDYRPLRVLTYQGAPVPWLILGDFELAYFNLDADVDARTIDAAVFLDYRDGAFVDVTGAVRDGTRPLRFFNARPDQK